MALTFDAADFTLEVELKLPDGTVKNVAIDVLVFNEEYGRIIDGFDFETAQPEEVYLNFQRALAKWCDCEPAAIPPGMARRVFEAVVAKVNESKKKEPGEPPSA